ncbi:MAG: GAF domain-containing protein [Dehalococcoidia bacterium]
MTEELHRRASGEVGTWEWDERSGEIRASPALMRLYGRPSDPRSASFDDFMAYLHPDDRERVLSGVEGVLQQPEAGYHLEYRVVLPDGGVRWLEVHGEVLSAPDEPTFMRGVCMEVTSEGSVTRLLATAYAVSRDLRSALDSAQAIEAVVRGLREALSLDRVEFWDASMLASGGDEDAALRALAGRAIAAGEVRLEVPAPPAGDESIVPRGPVSIAVPVADAHQTRGVLVLVGDTSAVPELALARTLELVAADLFDQLTRLELTDGMQRRVVQQRAAADIGKFALEHREASEVVAEAIRLVRDSLGVEFVQVLELLPDGERLRLMAGAGWAPGLVGEAIVPADAASDAGYTLYVSGPVIVNDLPNEGRFAEAPLLREHGIVSGLSTVVRGRARPRGVIGAYSAQPRQFSVEDATFLRSVANVISTALEREELDRFRELLLRADQVLYASLDYRQALRTLADFLVTHVADWCVLRVVDESGVRRLIETAHADPSKRELIERYREALARSPRAESEAITTVVRDGRAYLEPRLSVEDLAGVGLSPETVELLRELDPRSVLVVPLRARGHTLGTMSLLTAGTRPPFTEGDREFAEDLGARAALALDNARLYEALNAALSVREDFVAIVSHELRTPLTSVFGYAARLQRLAGREALQPEVAEAVGTIHTEAARMTAMLRAFEEMAMIEASTFELRDEDFDLRETVIDVIERVASEHPRARFDLEGDGELLLSSDPERVEIVLKNLVENAAKYGGEPPVISIQVEPVAGGGGVVRVRDNGGGISASDREHVFERFYRGARRSERGRGLGLGLYVSREITARLGGTLSFESVEGEGTEFTLELPSS